VTLLAIMLMLKLMEMRARRDVLVVVSLCYFVLLTHFLYSQELWTVLYLLVCATVVTAILIEVNHLGEPLPVRVSLRMGAVMVLQALPLMLVFFILFPRIPGPLWGLPADAGAARSGIADTLAPGDISRLIESDQVAFRARFSGPPPAPRDLYWRGPVFWYFDGAQWRAPFRGDDYFLLKAAGEWLNAYQTPQAEVYGEPVRYEVTLEPHRQNWMFALDLPGADALPPDAHLTGYYQLLSRQLVKSPLRYAAVSYPNYRLEPGMSEQWQRSGTRLPEDRNPRAIALAHSWRAEGLDAEQIITRALQMFREQAFYYTLQPPTLGRHMVDEFLFQTRRGFCEHYASSFTMLMRAAGIPARVVVGYQGGEYNPVGGYYVVRQSDAHAWSEVWLPERGWIRIDPTAAVAPSRIESGISAALQASELPGFLRRDGRGYWYWRLQADVAWDWVNVMWDRWVLAYNDRTQQEFLRRFRLDDWQNMIIALTVLTVGLMAMVGFFVLLQLRPAVPADRALLLWRRAVRRLARAGLPQSPHEGPEDYARRVAGQRPELAPVMDRLLRAYLQARYLGEANADSERALRQAANALRPS
jgi:protein-glutamine gamma-glutamyltransferase